MARGDSPAAVRVSPHAPEERMDVTLALPRSSFAHTPKPVASNKNSWVSRVVLVLAEKLAGERMKLYRSTSLGEFSEPRIEVRSDPLTAPTRLNTSGLSGASLGPSIMVTACPAVEYKMAAAPAAARTFARCPCISRLPTTRRDYWAPCWTVQPARRSCG